MSARLRLALVRHGETVGNSRIRYYGRTDLALAESGRRQMAVARDVLAQVFGLRRFDRAFASSLQRARESAEIIVNSRTPIIEIADFIEIDFGDFEGLTADEIAARFPDQYELWQRDRLASGYAYPNGESRAAFIERVDRGIAKMLEMIDDAAPADTILLVAHRGVIRAIVKRLVGAEPTIELGSIQLLTRGELRTWKALALDHLEHPTKVT